MLHVIVCACICCTIWKILCVCRKFGLCCIIIVTHSIAWWCLSNWTTTIYFHKIKFACGAYNNSIPWIWIHQYIYWYVGSTSEESLAMSSMHINDINSPQTIVRPIHFIGYPVCGNSTYMFSYNGITAYLGETSLGWTFNNMMHIACLNYYFFQVIQNSKASSSLLRALSGQYSGYSSFPSNNKNKQSTRRTFLSN